MTDGQRRKEEISRYEIAEGIKARNWLRKWMEDYFKKNFGFVYEKECNR